MSHQQRRAVSPAAADDRSRSRLCLVHEEVVMLKLEEEAAGWAEAVG